MPVIEEYEKVRREPWFQSVMQRTRAAAVSAAEEAWGLKDGGLYPGPGEFGETPIRLPFFNLGTTSGTAETWNRNLPATGWQTLIDQNVIEDVYIGIIGWMFPSACKRVAGLYMEAGDTKLPVVNFEAEIQLMDEPVIMYEQGVVIPEESPIKVEVLVTSVGHNVIKPLGFALAKPKILISKKPV